MKHKTSLFRLAPARVEELSRYRAPCEERLPAVLHALCLGVSTNNALASLVAGGVAETRYGARRQKIVRDSPAVTNVSVSAAGWPGSAESRLRIRFSAFGAHFQQKMCKTAIAKGSAHILTPKAGDSRKGERQPRRMQRFSCPLRTCSPAMG